MEGLSEGKEQTIRLYFDDPYRVEFEAEVVKKSIVDEYPALILDQTCFYPESGGQPADMGTINGIKTVKIFEDGEKIVHVVEEEVSSDRVKGEIDWKVRFDHMQQHSGQHILSQSFYVLCGGETLSFHMGDVFSTVEIDLREINEKDVQKVEEKANEILFENREIKTYFVPEGKIDEVPLRKPAQKKGDIRVVEVSGFDYSACGGTHCRRTGEIGLIKILKWERIRNNIRFDFVCGQRALLDYRRKSRILRQLSTQLSVHEMEVISSVEKTFSELKFHKKEIKKFRQKMAVYEAREIRHEADEDVIRKIFVDRTPEELRFLALNIIKRGEHVVLFALKMDKRMHFVFAASESLEFDMRELVPLVASIVDGKGGGSQTLVEISGEKLENLELALEKVYEFVKSKYG